MGSESGETAFVQYVLPVYCGVSLLLLVGVVALLATLQKTLSRLRRAVVQSIVGGGGGGVSGVGEVETGQRLLRSEPLTKTQSLSRGSTTKKAVVAVKKDPAADVGGSATGVELEDEVELSESSYALLEPTTGHVIQHRHYQKEAPVEKEEQEEQETFGYERVKPKPRRKPKKRSTPLSASKSKKTPTSSKKTKPKPKAKAKPKPASPSPSPSPSPVVDHKSSGSTQLNSGQNKPAAPPQDAHADTSHDPPPDHSHDAHPERSHSGGSRQE